MSKRKTRNKATQPAPNKNHLELREIRPLTTNQKLAFDAYDSGSNLILHGYAGVGKSFLAMYLGLDDVINEKAYGKIVLIRSVVPSREMGFLPGSIKDKTRAYEDPYYEIVGDLFGRGDAYDMLKQKGIIQFTTTSFLRGTTFNDAIVIADEIQNMTFPELHTIMTRLGNNSKIIMCGDFRQTDFVHDRDKAGLQRFLNITRQMEAFTYVEFEKTDIVRSALVKAYIIAATETEYQ
jgi:phosphate starvation-inducible protein PhoH